MVHISRQKVNMVNLDICVETVAANSISSAFFLESVHTQTEGGPHPVLPQTLRLLLVCGQET